GIKALAHITGSGALGKLHRILPTRSENGVRARINLGAWTTPPVFKWLNECAGYSNSLEDQKELLRTFNCGIGMVVVAAKDRAKQIQGIFEDAGESTFQIGEIENHRYTTNEPEEAVTLSG